jgi:peptide/nickel transport system permease protein
MRTYVLQRLLLFFPTLFGVTCVTFAIMHLAPGGPCAFDASGLPAAQGGGVAEAMAACQIHHGLDQPLYVQYGRWLHHLSQLDFGYSLKDHQPVWNKIAERLPVTVQLNVLSVLLVYVVAIPLGIYAATHAYTVGDQLSSAMAFFLFSLPSFWLGTIAIVFLCGGDFWYLFPPGGLHSVGYSSAWTFWERFTDGAWHMVLPVLMLSYSGIAFLSRYMRSSILENIHQDFVQTARAKGLSERVVLYKHVLRNSLIPIVTLMASILPGLISGSVIMETIFSIPGLGFLGYEALLARDYPVLMAVFTMSALLTLVSLLLSDILLTVVDPRITFTGWHP